MRSRMDDRTQNAVEEFGWRLGAKYDVRRLVLFGSRARGDHRDDSDADVLVVVPELAQSRFQTVLEMSDLAYYVGLDTGVIISPLPVTTGQWEHPDEFSNPALLRTIAAEGVLVPLPPAKSAGR